MPISPCSAVLARNELWAAGAGSTFLIGSLAFRSLCLAARFPVMGCLLLVLLILLHVLCPGIIW